MSLPIPSRVARLYAKKTACGANCNCGCGGSSPMEVYSEFGALPVEVEVHRVDASEELHPDGESYMSVQALESMREHAEELLQEIESDTPLPDWVESKLARASQSLLDVYEYMAHGQGRKTAQKKLLPGQFHVEYPHSRILRLLVYAPGHSTFFDAPANANAVPKLLTDLANAGLVVDPDDLQEAIEMA